MRTVSLSAVKAGITRLRVKGGASPDSLYDAVNCYVTAARTIQPRVGSQPVVFDGSLAGTIGLSLLNDVFQVFSDKSVSGIPDGYKLNVLNHPDGDEDQTLVRIWKAEPFMQALYVVAEWSDGKVAHYYLQMPAQGDWKPLTTYRLGELTVPTVPNGLTYMAHRLTEPGPVWAPSVERELDDVVEPTTFNNFEYVVVEAIGNPPRSGTTEPKWIAEDGALVIEEADVTPAAPPQQPPPFTPPPGYGNPGGGRPRETQDSQMER